VIFEDFTGELASLTEATLRKHGKDIAEMQYVQRRLAEMAMDLFGLAACIARTTRAIERRGEEGARREIDLTTIFSGMVHKRLRQHVSDFQKNDDELRKAAAVRAYADRAYPFDVL
jgi:acyl-CoA dehydrogenase family protein 9